MGYFDDAVFDDFGFYMDGPAKSRQIAQLKAHFLDKCNKVRSVPGNSLPSQSMLDARFGQAAVSANYAQAINDLMGTLDDYMSAKSNPTSATPVGRQYSAGDDLNDTMLEIQNATGRSFSTSDHKVIGAAMNIAKRDKSKF